MKLHEFNSKWWGKPVGVGNVDDYCALEPEQRRAMVAEYDWIELRGQPTRQQVWCLSDDGFACVDQQVSFRVGLRARSSSPTSAALAVITAKQEPPLFDLTKMALFERERFWLLPGVDEATLQQRFALWGRVLTEESPETCLALVNAERRVQGWFLSRPDERGLELTLAMLSKDSEISGFHLYERGLAHYGASHAMGWASFSGANTAVLNIYARLGASFVSTQQYWLNRPRRT